METTGYLCRMGKKGAGKKGKGDDAGGSQRKVVVLSTDMTQEMQDKVVAAANEAMLTLKIEKDIATFIKKKFDEQEGGTWHAIAGKDFGCSICHDTAYVMFFQLDSQYILVFKSQE